MADYFDQFEEVTPKSKVKAKLQEKGKLKVKEDEDYFAQFEEVAEASPVESPTKPLPVEAAPVKEEGLLSKIGGYAKKGLDVVDQGLREADSVVGTTMQAASQAITQGFQDEASGRINAVIDTVVPDKYKMHPEAKTFDESVDKSVDDARNYNKEQAEQNPWTDKFVEYGTGLAIPGGALTVASRTGGLLARSAKTLGLGAASGGVNALGGTESKLTDGETWEKVGTGAGVGALTSTPFTAVDEVARLGTNIAKRGVTRLATGAGKFPEGEKFVGNSDLVTQAERAPIEKRKLVEANEKLNADMPTEVPQSYQPPISRPETPTPDFDARIRQTALQGSESITKALEKQRTMASDSYEAAKKVPEMEQIILGRKTAAPQIYESITKRLPLLTELSAGDARKLAEIRDTLHVIRDGQPVRIRETELVKDQPISTFNPVTRKENLDVLVRAKQEVSSMIPGKFKYSQLDANGKTAANELKAVRFEISKIIDATTDALPDEARKLWKEGDRLFRVYKGSEKALKQKLGKKDIDPTKGGDVEEFIDEGRIITASKMDPSFRTSKFIDGSLDQIGASNPLKDIRGINEEKVNFSTQQSKEKTLREQAEQARKQSMDFEDKLNLERQQKPFIDAKSQNDAKMSKLRTLETEFNTTLKEGPGFMQKYGAKPSVKIYNFLKKSISPGFAATMRFLMLSEKSISAEVIRAVSKQHNVPEEKVKDIIENPEKHMDKE